MNVPPASGSPDDFRSFIAETAERAAAYAEHVASYAQLGDDTGLHRAVRMMTVCAVKAAETLPMLAEAARQDAAMRAAARALAE
ncbi:MAG: hypothetical protein PGN25_05615 [Methylorubrum populi]